MITSLIKSIRKHFADKRKQKRMQAFCEEKCFKLDGNYGFSIGGLIVREFAYLLRFVSDGKHESFDDFVALREDIHQLKAGILKEYYMTTPTETERLGVDPATAKRNMQNLDMILSAIAAYATEAEFNGFPPNPLLD